MPVGRAASVVSRDKDRKTAKRRYARIRNKPITEPPHDVVEDVMRVVVIRDCQSGTIRVRDLKYPSRVVLVVSYTTVTLPPLQHY